MLEPFPALSTERLSLIAIGQEHLADIFKLFSDDRVTQYYNIVTLKQADDAQKFIDWFNARFAENLGIRWGFLS
jgi:ribosomal-protein-alanine N-acetyltransferase